MAMTMSGEVQLSASRDRVWAMLNDPAVLKGCIPGCEQMEKTGENQYSAKLTAGVAIVTAAIGANAIKTTGTSGLTIVLIEGLP